MKRIKRNKNNEGYAILFTVVVVGIISMITIGLSNSAYKQTILSAVAKDSTTAFYQADVGSECVLYVDREYQDNMTGIPAGFKCGGYDIKFNPSVTDPNDQNKKTYSMNLETGETSTTKCFRADIVKKVSESVLKTDVYTKGYNICKKNNLRTVERGIKVSY